MIEAQQVYEMFVFSSTRTKVIAQQYFNAYVCHETFNDLYILILPSHPGLCLPCDLFHLGPSHLFVTRMQCL